MSKLILASTSVHRKKILQQLSLDFESHAPCVDERQLEKEFRNPIERLPEYLARKKAESLLNRFHQHPVIGSDQVLLFKGKTLNKPNTDDEVMERLNLLQNNTHELHTALCFIYKGHVHTSTTVARLTMHPLTPTEIAHYVQLDHPIGCAGGYKIEAHGPLLFQSIETSDFYSIVGLPVLNLVALLRKEGLLKPR